MKIKDLLLICPNDVVVYRQVSKTLEESPEFEDIYIGKIKNAPAQILNSEIFVLGAKKENVIEIQII